MQFFKKLATIVAKRDAHSAISIFTLGHWGHKEMVQTTKSINKNLLASVRSLELSQQRTNRNCMVKFRHEQNNKNNIPKLCSINSKKANDRNNEGILKVLMYTIRQDTLPSITIA